MGMGNAEFARLTGKAPSYIANLKSGGKLVIDPVDGKIDKDATLAKMSGWAEKRTRRSGPQIGRDGLMPSIAEDGSLEAQAMAMVAGRKMLSHADAVTKKENYLAALRELEYDVETKKVVVLEAVIVELTKQFTAMRAALSAVPSKIAPRVIMMNSATEAQEFIEEEIREIQNILSTDALGKV